MRSIQLVGSGGVGGDIAIDAATGKFMAALTNAYKSDSSMASSGARKNNLLAPPIPARLLEIHMILSAASGTTGNPVEFKFHIVNLATGGIASTLVTTPSVVNPTSMSLTTWHAIYEVRYGQASVILPGQYLQMEFKGYAGSASVNTYSCQAYWRLMVAS